VWAALKPADCTQHSPGCSFWQLCPKRTLNNILLLIVAYIRQWITHEGHDTSLLLIGTAHSIQSENIVVLLKGIGL